MVSLVEPLAGAFLGYLDLAYDVAGADLLPAPGSVALLDELQEQRLEDVDWPEPVRTAHMHGAFSFHSEVDHARTLAAALSVMRPGPIYSHATLMRACLEASRLSIWLHDVGISTDERVKRSLRRELTSATNVKHMMTNLGKTDHAVAKKERQKVERVTRYALGRGWVLDAVKEPTIGEHFVRVLNDEVLTPAGTGIWHLSFGIAHGDLWALSTAMKPGPRDPITGRARGALVIDGSKLVQSVGFVGMSLIESVGMRLRFYGVEERPAVSAARTHLLLLLQTRWHTLGLGAGPTGGRLDTAPHLPVSGSG